MQQGENGRGPKIGINFNRRQGGRGAHPTETELKAPPSARPSYQGQLHGHTMPAGEPQKAKRALVAVLLALAAAYGVALAATRDSPDGELVRAYRRLLLRVHPDKGGTVADQQRLQAAKEAWDAVRSRPPGPQAKAKARAARPKAAAQRGALGPAEDEAPPRRGYRINGLGVLLTYNRVRDVAQWERFVVHVRDNLAAWGARNYSATLETCKDGRLHIHVMLQFAARADVYSSKFDFEGLKANAQPNEPLGGGAGTRNIQQSINRGMFYCWAEKIGCARDPDGKPRRAANYEPCWSDAARTYAVKGRWVDDLWKSHKITHAQYETYMYLARDGVLSRRRNLDAVREHEATAASSQEIEARVRRIRRNPDLFRPFPPVGAATEWLARFREDALRYPFLVARGPSGSGKTEWAKSLFQRPLELKIGSLTHFPEGMRDFTRGFHDGIVLDDVRDLRFLVDHQDKVQGKYDALLEFGSTPGGQLAYRKDLFQVPIVVTINNTTQNQDFLFNNDFLGNAANRVLVDFPLAAPAAGAP